MAVALGCRGFFTFFVLRLLLWSPLLPFASLLLQCLLTCFRFVLFIQILKVIETCEFPSCSKKPHNYRRIAGVPWVSINSVRMISSVL
jgi:hypothetical protein